MVSDSLEVDSFVLEMGIEARFGVHNLGQIPVGSLARDVGQNWENGSMVHSLELAINPVSDGTEPEGTLGEGTCHNISKNHLLIDVGFSILHSLGLLTELIHEIELDSQLLVVAFLDKKVVGHHIFIVVAVEDVD